MTTSPIYWDASAILSALIEDEHSVKATRALKQRCLHIMSTLGAAEVIAVIQRACQRSALRVEQASSVLHTLREGPWQKTFIHPQFEDLERIAARSSLRGADLWHLGCAMALSADIPELRFLSFDRRLVDAARTEEFPLIEALISARRLPRT